MYRRRTAGWLKHYDFIILDLICLHLGYYLACCIRAGHFHNPYANPTYTSVALFLTLVDVVMILLGSMENIVTRGRWQEFKRCAASAAVFVLMASLYLFSMKVGQTFSRIVVYLTGGMYMLLCYPARCVWKTVLRKRGGGRKKDSMLVAANLDEIVGLLATLRQHDFDLPTIRGIILLDGEPGMEGFPYPVVANLDTMTDYITRNWVDELLVDTGGEPGWEAQGRLAETLEQVASSGVAVHTVICPERDLNGRSRMVESIGGYTVLTDSIRIVSMRQAILKRCLDIAGGLVGCVLTGLILLIVGPILYIKSPGPIIFKQTRIGRNGKPFTMYKIRSMCMDAEERKKDLVAANRVADGMMFKLDYDPRIIGTKQLPDGTWKKGIGNYIRDFSLDEFPQFFNVLKGDMSLVGTRPPTLDEWEKYTPYHRARMTFRPGITGLWQVSGRSNITDFDEVIRLDMRYISTWSAGQDFRILLQTVKKVLKRDGAK